MRWSDAIARPTDRQLGEFAACLAVAAAALATWHAFGPLSLQRAGLFAALSLLAALVGMLRPRWLAPLFSAWMILAFPVAWLVSIVVLGLIFFLLFTPLAILFRLAGRDTLDRRLRPGQDSYWKHKPAARQASDYFRQF